MKPTAKACWLTDGLRRLVAVLLAGCALHAWAEPAHLTQAAVRIEAGAGWDIPAAPAFDPSDAQGWTPVTLPHARGRSVAASGDTVNAPPEVAWYRIEVPAAQRGRPEELFIYLPRWQTIGSIAIYADDRLVHRSRGSRVWNSFNRPVWVSLTGGADAVAAAPRHVLVRMASQQGVGGAVSTVWIGPANGLEWRWQAREWIQSDLIKRASSAFFIIGLFSFAVWCVRRRETIYLFFFAASITHLLRGMHYTMGDSDPPLPDAWFGWITVNSLGWAMVFIFAFAFRVHRKRMPRLEKLIVALVLFIGLSTLPVRALLPHLDAILPLVYIAITSLTAIVAASGLWASWVSGSREGVVMSAWLALYVPAGVHDLMLVGYRIDMERIYVAPYVSIGLFAIFLVIVWRRYVGAIGAVETTNANLESRLALRERELAASYDQLRGLERERTLSAERQRMMQDMHDGIGSSLMSALRAVEQGELRNADMAQVLKECIDDLKVSIDSLSPTDADLLALLASLRFRLAPRLQAAGIKLTWSVQDVAPLPWLDAPSALHILRIVQEILTNIIKHGAATAIDISTGQDERGVAVCVHDNGRPFVPSPEAEASGPVAGRGLANVRSRALALGAQCAWTTGEAGNEFRLTLPLAQ
jgi:signal transduction histidine kinase